MCVAPPISAATAGGVPFAAKRNSIVTSNPWHFPATDSRSRSAAVRSAVLTTTDWVPIETPEAIAVSPAMLATAVAMQSQHRMLTLRMSTFPQ